MDINPEIAARGLSPAEARLVSKLEFEDSSILDIDTIERLTGSDRNGARLLASRLAKRGWLVRIRKGVYQFVPAKMAGYPRRDWFIILQGFTAPYYLSFLSAAYHYSLSPQRPAFAQIATPRLIRGSYATKNHGIEQVVVGEGRFFGIREEASDGLIIKIADPERTVVDCLGFPKRSGGLFEVARIIQRASRQHDLDLLVTYALQFGNKSLLQRLGYLLELVGGETVAGALDKLAESIGRRRAYLGSVSEFGRHGDYVSRWGLIDNIGQERLLAELEY
ncbi:MAG: hypothetical protein GEU75_07145 [Dehalococcoidia bacterium]|nr:hypothetical protein [Dehalococcoidia bacterium]